MSSNLSDRKVTILVVDDEELARQRLTSLLEEHREYQVCAEAENGAVALKMNERYQPDLVLLDVSMPIMDGLEVAKHLSSLDNPPAVIFTTSYGEYALEAFSTNAKGYLMKPIRYEPLLQVLTDVKMLNRVQRREFLNPTGSEVETSRKHICARLRGNLELILIEDIYYFQADKKYVTVHHNVGEVIIDESLNSLEKEFSDKFIRVHRNALVSKVAIKGMSKTSTGRTQIVFDRIDDKLEVGRMYVPELLIFTRNT